MQVYTLYMYDGVPVFLCMCMCLPVHMFVCVLFHYTWDCYVKRDLMHVFFFKISICLYYRSLKCPLHIAKNLMH